MSARFHSILFCCVALMFGRCKPSTEKPVNTPGSDRVRYAEGFKISQQGNATRIDVTYPYQGASSGYTYLLVPRGQTPPEHSQDVRVIYTPVERIVCTSTTHIPLLDYLGVTDALVGFPSPDYISSEKMRARIDEGKVTNLGIDKGLNLERLAVLKPDLVMGYTMTSDYGQFRKIESMNIPVVINAEYLEHHPLGRAEWIKFVGAFFNREAEADSIFRAIEHQYQVVKAAVDTIENRPTVLTGIVYGDAWFLPAGENYAARILNDAACHYLWSDMPGNGFLELSFETVFAKAHDADFWIGTGPYDSRAALSGADQRYSRFKPYWTDRVYHYDALTGARGGNVFLELGYLRPDIILRDIIEIAHPSVLDHELYFYRKLE